MTRAAVSVVMPFAGTAGEGSAAAAVLAGLNTRSGDELIIADNAGLITRAPAGVSVVRASGERSPAHARNAGAAAAGNDWILFIDADTQAPADLLDRFFATPIGDDVAAVAGEVEPAPGAESLAERYATARNFLGQSAHLAHPYLPRAAAANLLVRASVFRRLRGFEEGLRAAEDTDFCWRLQRAGWRLELRSAAVVQHRYRSSVRELRRQWREYAAGRAWLARRYDGFTPQPAVVRALKRLVGQQASRASETDRAAASGLANGGPGARESGDRWRFLALDIVLAIDELVGFAMSNEPKR